MDDTSGMTRDPDRPARASAVTVLSGGQDSAICLALACRRFGPENVAAITFEYGQRHAIETRYASSLAKRFGIAAHKIVRMDFLSQITSNALMSKSGEIEWREGERCPNTVVEGRNAFFLLAAAVWGKSLGARTIYTGVSEADFSGYPDCREEFVKAHEKAVSLALDMDVAIETPFMHMTKAQEWALASELGIFEIVRDETVTCYNGIPGSGCGQCPACKLRNRGLAEYMKNRR